jgi:hypothetical protein
VKWGYKKKASRQNGEFIKWQIDEMTIRHQSFGIGLILDIYFPI